MWEKGDIVQVDPDHDEIYGSCLMIVLEPKSWGAEGYFQPPGKNGLIPYRVNFNDAIKVGSVEWIVPEE